MKLKRHLTTLRLFNHMNLQWIAPLIPCNKFFLTETNEILRPFFSFYFMNFLCFFESYRTELNSAFRFALKYFHWLSEILCISLLRCTVLIFWFCTKKLPLDLAYQEFFICFWECHEFPRLCLIYHVLLLTFKMNNRSSVWHENWL